MTPRERFIAALERRPLTGRVPTFELVFFLTMEAFGHVHPTHRVFRQWDQMSDAERGLHLRDIAAVYVETARRYEHNAIFPQPLSPNRDDDMRRMLEHIREISGDDFFLMLHGDATHGMPTGTNMVEQTTWFYEHIDEAKDQARTMVDGQLERQARMRDWGVLDGFALCTDYCYNDNPFLPPPMFAELVAPYLTDLIAGQRELGYYVIKHTDGNIMPIIDQLVDANPHALHSLDPQGGVDIARVKREYGDRVCLIGNVNCGLLQSGTLDEVAASARYCLEHGMPGGGYIFSTSNCVYTGLDLDRYDYIWRIWHEEGVYPDDAPA
jgi:uroporphyrinogen decarboxylase